MLIACWSVKGGSGTTVVAAALGLLLARGDDGGAVLADLAGEAPTVLGLADPSGPGLTEWLQTSADAPDALARLAIDAGAGLSVLPRGSAPWPGEAGGGDALVGALATLGVPVVADCGLRPTGARARVVESADSSLLVLRSCYLAVRRALAQPLRPSGLVVVVEPGRSLSTTDLQDVLGVPIRAVIEVDPAVARAVDAGLLAARLPRLLEKGLRRAA